MLNKPAKLLIVDDDVSIRVSLSLIFSELGYRVRSGENGFSALSEIRKEIPDVLLSDLNMACMSGVRFLMVVRRRFPSIRVIAMGGVFSGNHVPHGVAADALYQKGAGPVRLIDAVDAMTRPDRSTKRLSSEALFGLQMLEPIPCHPGSEPLPQLAERSFALLMPQRSERMDYSQYQELQPINP
jgi:DNA-binding NtrC family response regulator